MGTKQLQMRITWQKPPHRGALAGIDLNGYEAATNAYHVAEAAPQRCVGGK